MEIVDMQLHNPAPYLDWSKRAMDAMDVQTEIVLHMMESVGVDAAVISPVEADSWAEELAQRWPEKFAVDTLMSGSPRNPARPCVRPDAEDVEAQIDAAISRPGVVAFRVVANMRFGGAVEYERLRDGGYDNALSVCQDRSVAIFLMASGNLELVAPLASKFPDLRVIVDHIGIPQRPMEQPDEPTWKALPEILDLGKFPNVGIKLCGLPALSDESYPYADVNDQLGQLIEAYSVRRLAWASDISRFRGRMGSSMRVPGSESYAGKHNYMESLAFILYNDDLSEADKEWLLGKSAREMLRWPQAGVGGATI